MNPLVDLWKNEITGGALRSIRHAWIHGEDFGLAIAEAAIKRGADEAAVLAEIEKCRQMFADEPRTTSAVPKP